MTARRESSPSVSTDWAAASRRAAAKWDLLGERYDDWRNLEYRLADYEDMFARVPEPCRVALDVGCGGGRLTLELAARCDQVVACDISRTMLMLSLRRLTRHGARNVRLVLADAHRPPIADARVDFVFSVHVLHSTDLDASLPALRRALAPGGRLAVRFLTVRRAWLSRSLPLRLAASLRTLPGYALRHGVATAVRVAALLLHPRWLRRPALPKRTPDEVAAVARRHLPGCAVTRGPHGAITVLWEQPVPIPDDPTSGRDRGLPWSEPSGKPAEREVDRHAERREHDEHGVEALDAQRLPREPDQAPEPSG